MKFLDLKQRKIIETGHYHREAIELQLQSLLDYKFSKFVDILQTSINNRLKSVDLESVDKPILFKFYTDLDADNLMIMRDQIIEATARAIIKDKVHYKNDEQILGLPEEFAEVDILRAVILELINYNLRAETITFEFISKDGEEVAGLY